MRIKAFLAGVGVFAGSSTVSLADYVGTDLNPPGFAASQALGVDGGRAIGFGHLPPYQAPPTPPDNSGHPENPPPPPVAQPVQALLWNGTAQSFVELNPVPLQQSPGGFYSVGNAISGNQQGGYVQVNTPSASGPHATLWAGTAASKTDIQPSSGGPVSSVQGTNGTKQVGYFSVGGDLTQAVIWPGTGGATILLALDSGNWRTSQATAISPDGNTQVGWATMKASPFEHALMWHNTTGSLTDLTPAGATQSAATGATNTQQSGVVDFGTTAHAAVWNGTADSFIDLHPASGFDGTVATSIAGAEVTGYGSNNGITHALVWTGTGGHPIDLEAYVPQSLVAAGFTESAAYGIDRQGNIVGWITNPATNVQHAFEWSPQGFAGMAASEGRILAQATPGDANFDGAVDFSDLLRLAQHYGATGADWSVGDFNGDGTVDFGDLLSLAQHYGVQPSAAQLASLGGSFAADAAAAFDQVPEPTFLALAVFCTVPLLRRRRTPYLTNR